jgi:DNA-binding LacI/PurR family transcriptional regulator
MLDAITRLNYRPTQGGGRAVMRNGRSIGLLIKEHDNPYYAQVADGVRSYADAHGYTLLIVSTGGDYETERRAVELLRAKDVDGLIVTPRDMPTVLEWPLLVQRLLERKVPPESIRKVLGANYLRVLKAIRPGLTPGS